VPTDELAPDVQAACIKAAKAFGRDIAGVDVVLHKDDPTKFYFFEVNRSPQIDHSSFTAEKAEVINAYVSDLAGGR
jgi:D-alanine-D-alanine ligase-like ATP-grasp enzyme